MLVSGWYLGQWAISTALKEGLESSTEHRSVSLGKLM